MPTAFTLSSARTEMGCLLIFLTSLACATVATTTSGLRVRKLDGAPSGTTILQCTTNSRPLQNPSWTKNDVAQDFPSASDSGSARVTAHGGNGTLVFSPTLPSDEARWRCNGGEEFMLYAPPFSDQDMNMVNQVQGSNFTLPCGVDIGPLTRDTTDYLVQWLRFDRHGNQENLIFYEPPQGDTTPGGGLHRLNTSDFSLSVFNFSVEISQGVPMSEQNTVHYRCVINVYTAVNPSRAEKETVVTFSNDDPQNLILSELQNPLVGHPGEEITASFLFRGTPFPEINWVLDGVGIPSESRPNIQVDEEVLDDGTRRALVTVTDAEETDTGLLNATVKVLETFNWTAGHLIIIPHIDAVRVSTRETSRLCGPPTLQFSLPKELPTDPEIAELVALKIRFSEVQTATTDNARTINVTFSGPQLRGRTDVSVSLGGEELPVVLRDYQRYRVEVLLVVGGEEGRQFSPYSGTIITNCSDPIERVFLRLDVNFEEGTCPDTEAETNALVDAVEQTFHSYCNFTCEDLSLSNPMVECNDVGTEGSFVAQVSAYNASGHVAAFYQLVQTGTSFELNNTEVTLSVCASCTDPPPPSEEEDMTFLYLIFVLATITGLLLLLIVVLAALAFRKRWSKETPPTIQLAQQQQNRYPNERRSDAEDEERLNRPMPLPRPPNTLPNHTPAITPSLEVRRIHDGAFTTVLEDSPPHIPHQQQHQRGVSHTAINLSEAGALSREWNLQRAHGAGRAHADASASECEGMSVSEASYIMEVASKPVHNRAHSHTPSHGTPPISSIHPLSTIPPPRTTPPPTCTCHHKLPSSTPPPETTPPPPSFHLLHTHTPQGYTQNSTFSSTGAISIAKNGPHFQFPDPNSQIPDYEKLQFTSVPVPACLTGSSRHNLQRSREASPPVSMSETRRAKGYVTQVEACKLLGSPSPKELAPPTSCSSTMDERRQHQSAIVCAQHQTTFNNRGYVENLPVGMCQCNGNSKGTHVHPHHCTVRNNPNQGGYIEHSVFEPPHLTPHKGAAPLDERTRARYIPCTIHEQTGVCVVPLLNPHHTPETCESCFEAKPPREGYVQCTCRLKQHRACRPREFTDSPPLQLQLQNPQTRRKRAQDKLTRCQTEPTTTPPPLEHQHDRQRRNTAPVVGGDVSGQQLVQQLAIELPEDVMEGDGEPFRELLSVTEEYDSDSVKNSED